MLFVCGGDTLGAFSAASTGERTREPPLHDPARVRRAERLALTRGDVVRSMERERLTKGVAFATGERDACPKPVCLAMTFAFSKVFCLRRGRRARYGKLRFPTRSRSEPQPQRDRQSRYARGSSLSARHGSRLRRIMKPPSIPPDHPFLWFSGRPLLAWFGRLLGKADAHHSCSQRPLRSSAR